MDEKYKYIVRNSTKNVAKPIVEGKKKKHNFKNYAMTGLLTLFIIHGAWGTIENLKRGLGVGNLSPDFKIVELADYEDVAKTLYSRRYKSTELEALDRNNNSYYPSKVIG